MSWQRQPRLENAVSNGCLTSLNIYREHTAWQVVSRRAWLSFRYNEAARPVIPVMQGMISDDLDDHEHADVNIADVYDMSVQVSMCTVLRAKPVAA